VSGDDDSQHSSSHSSSGESNSNSGSESDADNNEGKVKQAGAPKDVQRPESNNAVDAKDDRVQKAAQISTEDVTNRELDTGE
jgi:hypothetical protein